MALTNASAGERTYLVTAFCGGVLVERDVVATAWHCVEGRAPESLDILVGIEDLCRGREGVTDRIGVRTARAADPSLDYVELVLERPAPTDPIPVGIPPDDLALTALGFGAESPGGPTRCTPRSVALRALPRSRCVATASRWGMADDRIGCAVAARVDGPNTCTGDSGSPIVFEGDGRYLLAGVTSAGEGCASQDVGFHARPPTR